MSSRQYNENMIALTRFSGIDMRMAKIMLGEIYVRMRRLGERWERLCRGRGTSPVWKIIWI